MFSNKIMKIAAVVGAGLIVVGSLPVAAANYRVNDAGDSSWVSMEKAHAAQTAAQSGVAQLNQNVGAQGFQLPPLPGAQAAQELQNTIKNNRLTAPAKEDPLAKTKSPLNVALETIGQVIYMITTGPGGIFSGSLRTREGNIVTFQGKTGQTGVPLTPTPAPEGAVGLPAFRLVDYAKIAFSDGRTVYTKSLMGGTVKKPTGPDAFNDTPLTRTLVTYKDGSKMEQTQTLRSGGLAGVDQLITKTVLNKPDGTIALTSVSVLDRKTGLERAETSVDNKHVTTTQRRTEKGVETVTETVSLFDRSQSTKSVSLTTHENGVPVTRTITQYFQFSEKEGKLVLTHTVNSVARGNIVTGTRTNADGKTDLRYTAIKRADGSISMSLASGETVKQIALQGLFVHLGGAVPSFFYNTGSTRVDLPL